MRQAALLAVLLAVALGAPAAAQHAATGGHEGAAPAARVNILFDRDDPVAIDIVAGDNVLWTNVSVRNHTVTADDESFDSGRLFSDDTFVHRFDTVGEVPYHCMLHPSIQGVVSVHDLLLQAPPAAASAGRAFVLDGRASSALAPGTAVTLEADSGAGFAPVTTATLGEDGAFSASFVPATTATYRAVAAGVTSPPVQVVVLDRSMTLHATRAGAGTVLRTTVAPASPRGHVVLQLFLPEHFGWWPVRKARLDGASSARFVVRTRRRLLARVVLTLPDGATRLAVSRTVHVGPPRRAVR
jgi:plastocyanin